MTKHFLQKRQILYFHLHAKYQNDSSIDSGNIVDQKILRFTKSDSMNFYPSFPLIGYKKITKKTNKPLKKSGMPI